MKTRGDRIFPGEQVSDVVWIQTSFLGDIVLTTGAMELVGKEFPHINQHLVTTKVGALALDSHPCLSSITVVDKRNKSIFAQKKALKNDLFNNISDPGKSVVLQPHKSLRSTILARGLGFPVVTYKETKLSHLASYQVDRVAIFHEAVRIALLTEGIGISRAKALSAKPFLTASEGGHSASIPREMMDHQGGLIGVAPGSVWGTKRWPVEKYRDVVRNLLTETKAGIVLLGGKEEKYASQAIKAEISGDRLWDLVGETTLDDLRSIYPKLDLLITNDSSPIHYGSAFNVKTLAIFGATVPAMGFGPLAEGSSVMEVELPCRPCSDHGPKVCPLTHFKCMVELSATAVTQKAISMFAGSAG